MLMSRVALMAGGEEGSEAWVLTQAAWKGLLDQSLVPWPEDVGYQVEFGG